MLNRWFKKESPILGMLGMGGGAGSNLVGGVTPAWDSFSNTTTFNHTGSDQSFPVPASTTKIGFMIWGAAGGSYRGSRSATEYTCGGSGGYTEGIVSVTGGETIIVVVGAGGAGTNGADAGYGGGGDGGFTPRGAGEWGTAGGGMAGIFASPGTVYSGNTWQSPAGPRAIAIAGGGAGYGLEGVMRPAPSTPYACNTSKLNPDGFSLPGPSPLTFTRMNMWHDAGGGGARGENGSIGAPNSADASNYIIGPGNPGTTTAAEGGYQTGGGRGVEASNVDGSSGAQGQGGNGADAPYEYGGGGGGGGWYGGGGGGASYPSPAYHPGGGGSGFIGVPTITYGSAGTSESNTFTGPSPHNSREYELTFTVVAPRATSEVYTAGYSPIYLSTVANSGPYYGNNAGKAPSSGSGALTGNNGRVVIRY